MDLFKMYVILVLIYLTNMHEYEIEAEYNYILNKIYVKIEIGDENEK